ncbi:MAG: wax ester/triacylglycerol synthase family O-acyltransferase [Acidimicrobiales bacterium]
MTQFLDPLDSAFLLLETPGTSMNIGAVIELDFGDLLDPEARFNLISSNIAARVHEIPIFTKRIVRAPFDLTWPVLIEDRNFDFTKHVLRVALPAPGTPDQFDALISQFLSQPLSQRRPLWQLLVIEGLEDGRAAVALKVHHALADGVSGAETFANLFDISPEVREPAPKAHDTPDDASIRGSWGLVRLGLRRLRHRPMIAVENVGSWLTRFYEIARALVRFVVIRRSKSVTPDQPSIFQARRSSLNAAPREEKLYHRLRVSLIDAKRAAKSQGASVTDFVMATTGGALRRLLVDRDDLPKKDIIAFAPINVRGDGSTAELGNQISGMLVALHIDLADPIERLRAIASDSAKTVGFQREHRAKIFQDVPRVLGPAVLSLGGKFISAFNIFDHIAPMANLMVSSVPGPPIPLWLSGHRVASAAPVGPLFGTFALNITVLGFEQYLEFGLLGCAEQMSDLSTLREYLFDEAQRIISSAPQS